MTSKEIVKRTVEMTGTPRVPIYFFNKDIERSDIIAAGYSAPADFHPKNPLQSEWGFVWEKLDDTMGQPKSFPLDDWSKMEDYHPPIADAPGRFDRMKERIQKYKDRYILGSLGISGFNLMTFIRGFENTLEDLYLEREKISKLADIVFGFEEKMIKGYGSLGVDAIAFGDDWGTQNSLMISPKLWREFFKPRYKRQFDMAHAMGLHVYFHSCGYCYDIIEDLLELGCDILNFNQPNIYGIERLGKEFGGRVCFVCPVDIQTTAVRGTKEDIYRETQRFIECLGSYRGGFVGYVEEYHSIGLSDENYQHCVDALLELGKYE